jgi:hypothetical protein
MQKLKSLDALFASGTGKRLRNEAQPAQSLQTSAEVQTPKSSKKKKKAPKEKGII